MTDSKKTPLSTAADLRARLVVVSVPGDDDEPPMRVACRRPDPLVLFASELLPLDIYAKVAEKVAGSITAFGTAALTDPGLYGDFIDRWVCAAAVTPRMVLTKDDASEEAIWVEDVPPGLRLAIFMKTNDRLVGKRVTDAVSEFRRHQRVDPDPGPGGAAVRGTAVESLVSQ